MVHTKPKKALRSGYLGFASPSTWQAFHYQLISEQHSNCQYHVPEFEEPGSKYASYPQAPHYLLVYLSFFLPSSGGRQGGYDLFSRLSAFCLFRFIALYKVISRISNDFSGPCTCWSANHELILQILYLLNSKTLNSREWNSFFRKATFKDLVPNIKSSWTRRNDRKIGTTFCWQLVKRHEVLSSMESFLLCSILWALDHSGIDMQNRRW